MTRNYVFSVLLLNLAVSFYATTLFAQGGSTISEYSESLKRKGGYIDRVKAHMDEQKEKDIDKFLHSLPEKPDDPKDNMKWLNELPKWDNFQGADPGDARQAIMQDNEYTTGEMFTQCQGQNVPHSFAEIEAPPNVHIDGPPPGLGGVCYSIHYEYSAGWEMSSGGCYKYLYHVPFCGDVWLWSDLISYNFPTHKIDVSEQPYATKYIPKEAYLGAIIPVNEEFLKSQGATTALTNLAMTWNTSKKTLDTLKVGSSNTIPDFSSTGKIANETIEAREKVPDAYRDLVKHTSSYSSRAYSRNIYDEVNLATLGQWWIPHVAQAHFFGTDIENGFPYAKSLSMSAVLASKFDNFFSRPRGLLTCTKNNWLTGKTPFDIDKFLIDKNDPTKQTTVNPADNLCLDRVGERFPVNETRRMHITDRSLRAIAANIDLMQALGEDKTGPKHTFHEDEDLFLALRNSYFKKESPKCVTLKELPKVNVEYDGSNIKSVGSSGERTVEVYTAFRGCWGFKGTEEGKWDLIPTWGSSQTKDRIRIK